MVGDKPASQPLPIAESRRGEVGWLLGTDSNREPCGQDYKGR